jgi:hypothetical protein
VDRGAKLLVCALATGVCTPLSACTPLRPLDAEGDAGRGALDAARSDAAGLDAAGLDAAGLDAGAPSDAPLPDAPLPDAPLPDAPGLDAFSPDAFARDASTPDAWAADAYSPDAFVSATPLRPSTPGDVVVSEIMPVPAGGDSDEWIELYNPSALQAFDLEGCDLQGRISSIRIRSRLVVMPRSYVTLGATGAPFPVDYPWGLGGGGTIRLDDRADRVAISCTGALIDEVLYDTSFPVIDRHSIMVESAVLGGADPASDNDLAASWCSAPMTSSIDGRDFGTPGEMNVCPP